MLENKRLGAALIIIGVLANNYVYLHDLIFGKYEEFENAIVLGWLAALLIIATLAVTAVFGLAMILGGLFLLNRAEQAWIDDLQAQDLAELEALEQDLLLMQALVLGLRSVGELLDRRLP